MTQLRKMMLEESQRRNYSADTTRNYLRVVADFAKQTVPVLEKHLELAQSLSSEPRRK